MLQPLYTTTYTVPSNKQRANKMYTAKPWLKILRHTHSKGKRDCF